MARPRPEPDSWLAGFLLGDVETLEQMWQVLSGDSRAVVGDAQVDMPRGAGHLDVDSA